MSKEKEEAQTKQGIKSTQKKYSKAAFLDAAVSTKERLILQVLLQDNVSYSKDDVSKLVQDWKQKGVKV